MIHTLPTKTGDSSYLADKLFGIVQINCPISPKRRKEVKKEISMSFRVFKTVCPKKTLHVTL